MSNPVTLSIRKRVALVLLDEARRLGRGLGLDDLVCAYEARFGPVPRTVLSNALSRSVQLGEVLKVGGRIQHLRYAHVEHPVPYGPTADPAEAIVEIVSTHGLREGAAMTTAAVHQALLDRGLDSLSCDQVRTKLKTLAHGSRRKAARAHGEWREPRIRCIERTSTGGRRALFWAPISGDFEAPVVVDRLDGVRNAVAATERLLGRPVSKKEVQLWAEAVEAGLSASEAERQAVAAVLAPRFRAALDSVAFRDAGSPSRPGAVQAVRTRFTSRGAYPCRYSAGEPSPHALAACVLEDLGVLLRPDRELESIEELARRGSGGLLDEIRGTRLSLLAGTVASACPTDGIEDWVIGGTALITASAQAVLGWVQRVQVRPSDRHTDLDRLQASLEHAEAFASIATAIAQTPVPTARTIASFRGEELVAFEPLAIEANEINGRSPRHWENQLSGARRTIGPTAGGISTLDRGRMLTWIDRPDAVVQLVRHCHLPHLGALVEEAEAVLGHVLRDVDVLETWLRKVPLGERGLRNGLVVALGLMGRVPPVGLAWPDPGQPDDAAAYCAVVALATNDESACCALADGADMRAIGAAAEIVADALARVESRCRLGVID
jgi:hypothetical protein